MGLDEDFLFDDECGPTVPKVRGRFQPKAKARPRKDTTDSIPNNTNEEAIVDSLSKLDTAPFVDVSESILMNSLSSSGSKESFTKQSTTTHAFISSDVRQLDQLADENIEFTDPVGFPFSTSEAVGTIEGMKVNKGHVPFADGCGEKAVGQNADLFSGLEFLDSQLTHNAGESNIQAQSSLNSDIFMGQDSETCLEAPISNDDGGIRIDDRRLESEVQHAEAFSNLDALGFMSEEIMTSGGHSGKYKPKPKIRIEKEKPRSRRLHQADAVESMLHQQHAQFVASETECMYEGSLPTSDEFDYSSIDLYDSAPPDQNTYKDPIDKELENREENSCEDTTLGDVPDMNKKLRSNGRKCNMANQSSVAHKETRSGKSSRQQKKQVAHDDTEPSSSSFNDDESDVDGDIEKSTSQKKRAQVHGKDKSVRKRSKTNEASEKSTKEPRKKFSHSTRRRRRLVSKELLETPETEIDRQKVPLRDLILLAEHKERLASKEPKTSTTPSSNQRTENSFGEEDYHNEEDAFGSGQGVGTFDNEAPRRVQSSSLVFNYHSFMNKIPKLRWSKQDTELFYEAIQQFGTDLSMIQQLFPGTTRRQIRLKFKKEEHLHPLRLSEALTNRANDYSHFEKVIEKLQEVAAQSRCNVKEDDRPVGLSAEEWLLRKHLMLLQKRFQEKCFGQKHSLVRERGFYFNATFDEHGFVFLTAVGIENEEPEKSKQDEKTEKVEEVEGSPVEDRGADVAKESSPLKADESDNDIHFDDYNFDY